MKQANTADETKRSRRKPSQPLDIINIPGALLTLKTLSAVTGQSISTIYRDEKAGKIELTRIGARCTRATSEQARSYSNILRQGAK